MCKRRRYQVKRREERSSNIMTLNEREKIKAE
jgi:hypothetical protein